ncbi:MAG: phosphoribosylformylglycinamidine synthase I [Candidatus Eisenbacteria bacterium]|nr:phosphoribosylformylglycinamidine synthase I [Candidatus Eisenbacteria bacterium]
MDRGNVDLRRAVAVLQLPGSNCERETLRAVVLAGGRGEIVRWNEPASRLGAFGAYVIPGGFSFQDRIRAGAVAARLPVLDCVAARAREGAPVLGICNGAQILVEAGLVPGIEPGRLEVVLAPNRMPGRDGYYTRWSLLGPAEASERCLFTRGMGDATLAVPMAHGEGRFTTRDAGIARVIGRYVALTYRTPEGSRAKEFPWNPNGSMAEAAGLTNARGNVLALMPHPERAVLRAQIPPWIDPEAMSDPESPGPGMRLFRALVAALGA